MSETRMRILEALDAGPVTGPALAEQLVITRAAVWKHVEDLRDAGFGIESGENGYRLDSVPDYGGDAIAFGLACPATIEYHDVIDSTNKRAKALASAGQADVAVVANEQAAGRGRLDRDWVAPPGGIYVSLLARPSLTPVEAPILTMATAVAAVDAVREAGVDAHIKWPNDVMIGTPEAERKLGGILTAVEGEADRLRWAIVGVGMNANVPAAGLPTGATSLQAIRGEPVDRRRIVQQLLDGLYASLDAPSAVLPAWRERAGTLDRLVRIRTPDGVVEGVATDVEPPGVLLVRTDDETVRVHAGDCEHLRPVTADD